MFNEGKFYSGLLEVIKFKIIIVTENKRYYKRLELANILRMS